MEYLVAIPALVLGWFLRQWTLFRGKKLDPPKAAYEVRLTRTAPYGKLEKVLYAGDDLQEAKRLYFEHKIPHNCAVELYTQGNHTATRS